MNLTCTIPGHLMCLSHWAPSTRSQVPFCRRVGAPLPSAASHAVPLVSPHCCLRLGVSVHPVCAFASFCFMPPRQWASLFKINTGSNLGNDALYRAPFWPTPDSSPPPCALSSPSASTASLVPAVPSLPGRSFSRDGARRCRAARGKRAPAGQLRPRRGRGGGQTDSRRPGPARRRTCAHGPADGRGVLVGSQCGRHGRVTRELMQSYAPFTSFVLEAFVCGAHGMLWSPT